MGSKTKRASADSYTDQLAKLRRGEGKHGGGLTADEEKKRLDLLERNRQAAQRCRKRKKVAQSSLEEQGNFLIEQNNELFALVEELREEVEVLRSAVAGHQQAADGCHSGGLLPGTVESILNRQLPAKVQRTTISMRDDMPITTMMEVASSPSSTSVMSRTSSRAYNDNNHGTPPTPVSMINARSYPSVAPSTTAEGTDKSPLPVSTPMVDPALMNGPGFPFFDFAHNPGTTPGGNNVDLSSLLN